MEPKLQTSLCVLAEPMHHILELCRLKIVFPVLLVPTAMPELEPRPVPRVTTVPKVPLQVLNSLANLAITTTLRELTLKTNANIVAGITIAPIMGQQPQWLVQQELTTLRQQRLRIAKRVRLAMNVPSLPFRNSLCPARLGSIRPADQLNAITV